MNFKNFFYSIQESNEIENVEYPYITQGSMRKRGNADWRKFKIGGVFSDGDVHRYVLSQHGNDFVDDDRIEGTYKFQYVNPNDYMSEWDIDDDKVKQLSVSTENYPPIVLNHGISMDSDGEVVDGGHRLEAAKLRGDKQILAFTQE